MLPADENILDFVVGDSEYWHLTGAANVAFLKPLRPDAATNIALVCESGRIYSFLVAEHSAEENERPPHLVVRFESGAEKTGLSGGGTGRPAFVARSEVAAYQQMAAEAAEAARSAREAAEAGILEARTQAETEIEEFRARYPERLAFEYRLDGDAARRPFLVEAMWHDGQFTYLRSHAQESPALYPDQSRLAVAFHRLLLPDRSWIDLEFTGLNQAGEGALQDQVDRHYFSTFAAAGAIGVVSGLALAGGSPFGLRAGVGQGLGQSATSVLDRFLNRLPTITIRAGHRLRIWFISDVLVPRPRTRH